MKTDFLRYSPDGTESPSSTFIVADPDTIEEKKIDLRVLYGSDPEVGHITCRVNECRFSILDISRFSVLSCLCLKGEISPRQTTCRVNASYFHTLNLEILYLVILKVFLT